MRKSKTLSRLRNGEVARVASLGHYIPSFVAHAARAGYDCIWLDLEHRSLTTREVDALLAQFHLHDIDCLLRTPTREKTRLYRYLEDGATGLMVPHVNSAEEARQLVSSVKFPPLGDRGLDGAGLDGNYYKSKDPIAYSQSANQETFLTIQIETPQAVDQFEEIASVDGIDAIFVGPGDLGFRYSLEGDPDREKLMAAFERVASICAEKNLAWGCPALSKEDLIRFAGMGGRLLVNFNDYLHLMNGLTEAARDFEEFRPS